MKRATGLIFLLPALAAAGVTDTDTVLVADGDGTVIELGYSSRVSPSAAVCPIPPPPDCDVLWQYHIDNGGPQRNCVAIGCDDRYVWSGGWYGGGKMFEMQGDGTPLWEFDREREFGVAAAEDADVFYGVWFDDRDGSFEVYRFHASSPEPDWTWDGGAAGYAPYSVDKPGRVACSADGGVLAVGGNDGDSLAVMFFTDDSPEPFAVYEDEGLAYNPRQLRLTADGSKCIFRASAVCYRVDVATATLEDSYDLGASTDCFGVSPDGSIVVYGFGGMNVLGWNGSEYEHLWYYAHPGSNYAGVADVAADDEEIVLVWYSTTYLQNWVTRFNVSDGPEPVWVYETHPGAGDYQDVPAWLELSGDGEWICVGYWGDQTKANPEVQVLKDSKPDGLWFGYYTPGSVFGVDISPGGEYVASAGKGVHANQMGSGGDVFAGYVDPESGVTVVSFEAESADDGVLVRWNAEGAVGVEIARDGEPLSDSPLPAGGAYLDMGLGSAGTYAYILRAWDDAGEYVEAGPVEVEYVRDGDGLWLSAPYPNPAGGAAALAFNLPEEARVTVSLYDLAGRRVATPLDAPLSRGRHSLALDTTGLEPGVYLVRLVADGEAATTRLAVVR
jgi:hypothetical protein